MTETEEDFGVYGTDTFNEDDPYILDELNKYF